MNELGSNNNSAQARRSAHRKRRWQEISDVGEHELSVLHSGIGPRIRCRMQHPPAPVDNAGGPEYVQQAKQRGKTEIHDLLCIGRRVHNQRANSVDGKKRNFFDNPLE